MTYAELFGQGRSLLEKAGVQEAELDARLLLEWVCHTSRNDLLVHGQCLVEPEKERQYLSLIGRRGEHIPLQYITGVQQFMGLEFLVNEKVLIPRQDTEILVEEVLRHLHDGMHILDMCTGSGCILISLLYYSNGCVGVGTDISTEALSVAEENADRLLYSQKQDMFTDMFTIEDNLFLIESNLFEKIDCGDYYDIIVSNPPYITSGVIDTLMPEVREHEPRAALDGGEDGLFFYRQIIAGGKEHLRGGGMLFFEIGYDQGRAVSELMEQSGFEDIQIIQDYAGLDRVVYGTRRYDFG